MLQCQFQNSCSHWAFDQKCAATMSHCSTTKASPVHLNHTPRTVMKHNVAPSDVHPQVSHLAIEMKMRVFCCCFYPFYGGPHKASANIFQIFGAHNNKKTSLNVFIIKTTGMDFSVGKTTCYTQMCTMNLQQPSCDYWLK